jgi:predicted amidohydrolase
VASDDKEEWICGEIDAETLRAAAEKFPVLNDADAFSLKN